MTREDTIISLSSRRKFLESIISFCRKKLASAPEGRVATSCSNGVAQFYFYNNCKGKRKYLSDKVLIEKLVSKEYFSKLLSCAENELQHITRFLEGMSKTPVEEIYKCFPEAKRKLIAPPYIVKHFLLEFTRFLIVPQNKDEPGLVDIPEYLVRK